MSQSFYEKRLEALDEQLDDGDIDFEDYKEMLRSIEYDRAEKSFKRRMEAFKENVAAKTQQKKQRSSTHTFWKYLPLLIFLVPILLATFNSTEYAIEASEPQVYMVKKTYWGLTEEHIPLRWLRLGGYDYSCWAAKSKTGSWYCAVMMY